MTAPQAYRLSRVQAEGWRTARALPASGLAALTSEGVDARNPYPADPERARWHVGFTSAF